MSHYPAVSRHPLSRAVSQPRGACVPVGCACAWRRPPPGGAVLRSPSRGRCPAAPGSCCVPARSIATCRDLRGAGRGAGGRDMASRRGSRSRSWTPPGTDRSRARLVSGRPGCARPAASAGPRLKRLEPALSPTSELLSLLSYFCFFKEQVPAGGACRLKENSPWWDALSLA